MIVLIAGDFGSGYNVIGPFQTAEDAERYSKKWYKGTSWFIAEMFKPTSLGDTYYYDWPNSPRLVLPEV